MCHSSRAIGGCGHTASMVPSQEQRKLTTPGKVRKAVGGETSPQIPASAWNTCLVKLCAH